MKNLLRLFAVVLCLSLALPLAVSAEDVLLIAPAPAMAEDITAQTTFSGTGYASLEFLYDQNIDYYHTSAESCTLTLENAQGIASLYLLFDLEYGDYSVTDNATGNVLTAGTYDFVHEFLDLEAAFGVAPTSVTLSFTNGAVHLSEIYCFSQGQTPDFVQKWLPPLEGGADILLFSTHGDDEQLYFAGLFPLYSAERGERVQVAYMTSHREDTLVRVHEMLNGLWQTGVTNYPVFGPFPDFRVDDRDLTYQEFARRGYSKEELLSYVVEQIRRFDPLVVIGHDFNGEYGHGMHRVYADLVSQAVEITMNAESYPESADKYGVWDVPKTYIHVYEENPIFIDYDTPLESFDGLTAFQVSQQLGYPCHKSQQIYKSLRYWLYATDVAADIELHNPCKFGLYRSTVGEDVEKNDFLENVVTYGEQERIEQERLEAERLEQERLEAERLEAERLEAERLEKERLEKERLEQERLEAERLEAERLAEQAHLRKVILIVLCGALAVVLLIVLILRISKEKKKTGKYSEKR